MVASVLIALSASALAAPVYNSHDAASFAHEGAFKAGRNADHLILPEERKHFKSLRQMTFSGSNAEAYWSTDDERLVLQSTDPEWGLECDQIFTIELENDSTQKEKMLSTGLGRTTCSYFLPGNKEIIYSSTHLGDEECPYVPPRGDDYIWPVYETFEIFRADMNGTILQQLTKDNGYDAEATVSPQGDRIVWTSQQSGDLELWTMNIDGTDAFQVTNILGYDGGAFFSPDGKKLIFRANHPTKPEDVEKYLALLEDNLVMPIRMEVFTINVDGTELTQITDLGLSNWAPFWHPSGDKFIFSSNHENPREHPFNLFLMNIDGTGLEKLTWDDGFDSFPAFSNNGKYLAFGSARGGGDVNVFVAEWME